MIELTADESRILGALIEKAMTTPEQYPLSLNATINAANQRNNREPILAMEENQVLTALEGLRAKGLVIRVDQAGSRVPKYRQEAREKLGLTATEVAVMAELLLRGPQTLGELRGHASRMYAMESMETVSNVLAQLADRQPPLVRRLPPAPGSRAERWAQLLCPDLHPLDAPATEPQSLGPTLNQRVAQLEQQVAQLQQVVRRLAQNLGDPDPFASEGSQPG